MQTFLPYPDLRASSVVLDDRRLGKQRVETLQILRALTWETYAWKNHPAVRMWRGFVPGLVRYGRENCREWMRRGYADSVADQLLEWSDGVEPDDPPMPPWFGWEPVHRSHRIALLCKEPAWYADLFPAEAAECGRGGSGYEYVWPADLFPTWPVRTHGETADLPRALQLLGLETPRPGQSAVVEAVTTGRDVLAVFRPGSGGSIGGLLGGLTTKGRTLVVTPPLLPRSPAVPAVVGPVPREVAPGDPVPLTGRAPGPADLMAMRAETEPPEFVFRTADRLDRGHLSDGDSGDPVGLIVVDRADRLGSAAAVVAARERLGSPPLLAIVGRADLARRDELVAELALRDPVLVGGGWDPGSFLDVQLAATPRARGGLLASLVSAARPALVVCPGVDAARRRAARLTADGLPAQVWAPPPMRAKRASAALAAFRARRLAALVVAVDALPPLGRGRLPLLVSEDPPSLESWRQEVEVAGADRSVAVVSPNADPDLHRLARDAECLRACLLDHFGEPVAIPCGRCSRCRPGVEVS